MIPVHMHCSGVKMLLEASYRERLTPMEGHAAAALLRTPLVPLLGVSDHNVLVESWIVM